MSLEILFKNELGEVKIQGGSKGAMRLLGIEGLGPLTREYTAALYSGYDGQETVFKRAMPRTITVSAEVNCENSAKVLKDAMRVFAKEGTLFINAEEFERRIECSQVQMPDISKILKGKIATFVVQFVCDSPYFLDAEDTSALLYERRKTLSSPFSLPTAFGEIVLGAKIAISGERPVEPTIVMQYPEELVGMENVTIVNETTGKAIRLEYAPGRCERVTIDIRNRKITGSIGGNIINCLSRDTFLGDFVLVPGTNALSVAMGDMPMGFAIGCTYANLYCEAVIV